jgi:hypothetical protein
MLQVFEDLERSQGWSCDGTNWWNRPGAHGQAITPEDISLLDKIPLEDIPRYLIPNKEGHYPELCLYLREHLMVAASSWMKEMACEYLKKRLELEV